MAFDFMDIFPDSPAAVQGSQGALDIINNQYKGAMGFMEMENALTRTVNARRQLQEQMRMDPLQKTVDAVKLLQGLNVSGQSPLDGVDLNDPNSVNQAIQDAAGRGQILSNLDADLMKTRASAQEQMTRFQMTEAGRNNRDAAERSAEFEKQLKKEAFDRVEELNKRYLKTPTSENKARQLVSDYQSLVAYGVPEAARVFYNKHSGLLAAAGFQAPGSAARTAPKPPPQAPVQPAPVPQAPQAPAQPSAFQQTLQAPPSGDHGLDVEKRLRAGFDAQRTGQKPQAPQAQPLNETEVINGVTYKLQNGKYVKVK